VCYHNSATGGWNSADRRRVSLDEVIAHFQDLGLIVCGKFPWRHPCGLVNIGKALPSLGDAGADPGRQRHAVGSAGDLPTELALWLFGLGVEVIWNPPRRPQDNGVVERSQGTGKRWSEPPTCDGPAELQRRIDDLDEIQRAEYPSVRVVIVSPAPSRGAKPGRENSWAHLSDGEPEAGTPLL
jgi:hypothetical protein